MTKSEESTPSTITNKGKKILGLSKRMDELRNTRIIQKNLVYVIGLSSKLANKETLSKMEYFGQYGLITKTIVNKNKAYNPTGPNGPSYSAYVSYSLPKEASLAILSIDNIEADLHTIRASFGTTKYCHNFLKSFDCTNKDCLYLHKEAEETDIICLDDTNDNKNVFYEQQVLAMKIADIFNEKVKHSLTCHSTSNDKKYKSIFPSIEKIYEKKAVIENYPKVSNRVKSFDSSEKYYKEKENTKPNERFSEDYTPANCSNANCEENEFEYILVRNNNKKLYSRKSSRVSSRKDISNRNKFVNFSKSEEDNIPGTITNINSLEDKLFKNRNELECKSGENSTISNTDDSKNENNIDIKNNYSESKFSFEKSLHNRNIYRRRECSRFGFVNTLRILDSEIEDKIDIPIYILDILYKKLSSYTFFKKFTSVQDRSQDFIYFEKDFAQNSNDSWTQLIKTFEEQKF